MLYFEWRRILRQKLRNYQLLKLKSKSKLLGDQRLLTYKQFNKVKIITSCIIFVVGWKIFGLRLIYDYFYIIDESTGERRLHNPKEIRKIIIKKKDEYLSKTSPSKLFGQPKPDRPPIELTKTKFELDT